MGTQVRGFMPSRVNTRQHGFVPGRTIHTVLDYFAAARVATSHSCSDEEALVLLLDFAKAYDTLNRGYSYATLRRHGFPPHLVDSIELVHFGTTVRFIVNGDM